MCPYSARVICAPIIMCSVQGSALLLVCRVKELGLDVCLVYGREDPWVVPLWGYRLKRALPSALYYELSPCGHCPHHEAPQVSSTVAKCILDCFARHCS